MEDNYNLDDRDEDGEDYEKITKKAYNKTNDKS